MRWILINHDRHGWALTGSDLSGVLRVAQATMNVDTERITLKRMRDEDSGHILSEREWEAKAREQRALCEEEGCDEGPWCCWCG